MGEVMQKKGTDVEKEVAPATDLQAKKYEDVGKDYWTPATKKGRLWPNED